MIGPYAQRRLQRRTNATFQNAGVDPQVGNDILEANPTGTRIRTAAVRDATARAQAVQARSAAQGAAFGTAAYDANPDRFGSAASARFAGQFGPSAVGLARRATPAPTRPSPAVEAPEPPAPAVEPPDWLLGMPRKKRPAVIDLGEDDGA
jgi:hypothetical protein